MATRGINKVILIGNLGKEPDVRYFPNGDAVAHFTIATSESWKDRNTGELQERTEWHRISVFGKLAEVAKQYLHKGSRVYIEGKLRTRKWQAADGQDRYTTEVVVEIGCTMQLLDSRTSSADSDTPNHTAPATPPVVPDSASAPSYTQPTDPYPDAGGGHAETAAATTTRPPLVSDTPFDDDIPF